MIKKVLSFYEKSTFLSKDITYFLDDYKQPPDDTIVKELERILAIPVETLIKEGFITMQDTHISMEWIEDFNFKNELIMKEPKKLSMAQVKVKEVFDSCNSFLETIIGRKKFMQKNLNVGQLQQWWHEVYSPNVEGPIVKDQLEDATIYISCLDRYQVFYVYWEKTLFKYEVELNLARKRINVIALLLPKLTLIQSLQKLKKFLERMR